MIRRSCIIIFLTFVYAVLWIGGVLTHLLEWKNTNYQLVFASLFLWTAAILSLSGRLSVGNVVKVLSAALLAYVAEIIGVTTGVIFGTYYYNESFGDKLFGVPLVIFAAWLILFTYVQHVVSTFQLPHLIKALCGALWMVAIDMIIDPVCVGIIQFWIWKETGAYYDIPFSNFVGWFVVSFVMFLMFPMPSFKQVSSHLVGFTLILFFTSLAATAYPIAVVVGIVLMMGDVIFLQKEWQHYYKTLQHSLRKVLAN